jgi:hypothetical protein
MLLFPFSMYFLQYKTKGAFCQEKEGRNGRFFTVVLREARGTVILEHKNPAGWQTRKHRGYPSCLQANLSSEMTVGVGFVVTSEQPSPLGWLARNRTAVAPNTTTSPRASKFCFLKLPIVFGYAVPFTAISKKQNRKGSPTSLIYPYIGKVASFFDKTVLCLWQGTSDSYEIPPAAVLLRTVHRGRCISKCKLLLCRCMHLAFSAKLRRVRKKVSIVSITTTFRTCSG